MAKHSEMDKKRLEAARKKMDKMKAGRKDNIKNDVKAASTTTRRNNVENAKNIWLSAPDKNENIKTKSKNKKKKRLTDEERMERAKKKRESLVAASKTTVKENKITVSKEELEREKKEYLDKIKGGLKRSQEMEEKERKNVKIAVKKRKITPLSEAKRIQKSVLADNKRSEESIKEKLAEIKRYKLEDKEKDTIDYFERLRKDMIIREKLSNDLVDYAKKKSKLNIDIIQKLGISAEDIEKLPKEFWDKKFELQKEEIQHEDFHLEGVSKKYLKSYEEASLGSAVDENGEIHFWGIRGLGDRKPIELEEKVSDTGEFKLFIDEPEKKVPVELKDMILDEMTKMDLGEGMMKQVTTHKDLEELLNELNVEQRKAMLKRLQQVNVDDGVKDVTHDEESYVNADDIDEEFLFRGKRRAAKEREEFKKETFLKDEITAKTEEKTATGEETFVDFATKVADKPVSAMHSDDEFKKEIFAVDGMVRTRTAEKQAVGESFNISHLVNSNHKSAGKNITRKELRQLHEKEAKKTGKTVKQVKKEYTEKKKIESKHIKNVKKDISRKKRTEIKNAIKNQAVTISKSKRYATIGKLKNISYITGLAFSGIAVLISDFRMTSFDFMYFMSMAYIMFAIGAISVSFKGTKANVNAGLFSFSMLYIYIIVGITLWILLQTIENVFAEYFIGTGAIYTIFTNYIVRKY